MGSAPIFPRHDSLTFSAMPIAFTLFESREPADIQSSAAERHRLALLRNRRTTGALHPGSGLTNTEAGVEGRRGTQAAEDGESHASTSRPEFNARQTEEAITRQLQAIRGATSRKLVASKAALQSLETVEMCSLAENEKSELRKSQRTAPSQDVHVTNTP